MKKALQNDPLILHNEEELENAKKVYCRDQMIEASCVKCNQIFKRRLRFFTFPPLCSNCSKKQTSLEHYGVEFISQSKDVKEKKLTTFHKKSEDELKQISAKRRQTTLLKYGVESYSQTKKHKEMMSINNPGHSDEANEKRKSTLKSKYGVENPFQIEAVKTKMKVTSLDHFGTEYPSQNHEIREKIKETNLKRYGVENPHQVEWIKDKIQNTKALNIEQFEKENNMTAVSQLKDRFKGHWANVVELYHFKGSTFVNNDDIPKIEEYCELNLNSGVSHAEKDLFNFVKDIQDDTIENDRQIIKPKELDIYIPSKKVAIEYDGLFWHCELNKENNYHLNKTLKCEQKGIRLIHIFEDEWRDKQDICKSIIKSSLGQYDKKYMARKLQFKSVDRKEAVEFFNRNHIQGFCNAHYYFGLYDNSELIQCISLGLNRFTIKEKKMELIRMATKINCQVVGGFSRLIKNAMKALSITELESYVDRRLFNAKGYISSGWSIVGESGPRCFYTDAYKRENRLKYTKQNCLKMWPDADKKLTEHQLCFSHGLYGIYDCGTIKMKFKLDN